MADSLSASVGVGATNNPADVELVQKRLLSLGYAVGRVDGRCGERTRIGIITYQLKFMKDPDGRIDPNGFTWKRLSRPTVASLAPAGDSLTRLVPAPVRSAINAGLNSVTNEYMNKKLGEPRTSYSSDCQPMTNERLRRNIETASVGPFRVSGLKPAVHSLQQIFTEIACLQPEVYAAVGTAGMLCCRYVRGSTKSISNHSWGTAIDLTIAGVLDKRGNGKVQYGLTLIAPIFNSFGWYWGATFPTEDGMHFEASTSLVTLWSEQLK